MLSAHTKKTLRTWLPPEFIRLYRASFGLGIRFNGRYSSWDDAVRNARGYDSPQILDKVVKAVLKSSESPERLVERDGVLLANVADPYPLIASLMRSAALNEGRLSVLDFGGRWAARISTVAHGSATLGR